MLDLLIGLSAGIVLGYSFRERIAQIIDRISAEDPND